MAYVDHTFSISEEDDPVGTSYTVVRNKSPIKELVLAAACLGFGSLAMLVGLVMMYHRVGGDRAHGIAFIVLGGLIFMPGIYQSKTAYSAYKGYKGFSVTNTSA